jgi:predicted DNA-binding transcriptional regulator YafY
MDVHAALTFNLVEQYMQNLLPRSTLGQLAPWFDAAHGVASSQASTLTKWRDKLRVVPHTLNKIPAKIDPSIQATIYSGLLNDKQVLVTYRAITSKEEPKTYPVHPLGLVVLEQVVYLVCTVKSYLDARFLALHRIEGAVMLETSAIQPAGFNIDTFIKREFGIRIGDESVRLVMRVRGVLGRYLVETPLAVSQTATPIDGLWTRIEATVPDTIQLRAWLRSLGKDAVVEEPALLRLQMEGEWQELVSLYSRDKHD